MASFADVQYCIYAYLTPLVGGLDGWVRKVQNHADVIYRWSQMKQERKNSRNQGLKRELSTIRRKSESLFLLT